MSVHDSDQDSAVRSFYLSYTDNYLPKLTLVGSGGKVVSIALAQFVVFPLPAIVDGQHCRHVASFSDSVGETVRQLMQIQTATFAARELAEPITFQNVVT